jgi:hypothetical protein
MPPRQTSRADDYASGVERLMGTFIMERKVFLGCIVIGVLLMVFLTVMTAFGKMNREDWLFMFAPNGAFLGMCMGALIYVNKTVDKLGGMTGGSDDR